MDCVECGRSLGPSRPTGRPRRYCSRSCQGRAYRRRRDEGRLSAPTRPVAGGGPGSTVETAVAMADADGLGTLTLRTVAHRAGLALTSLQRDVGSRDRLVATMVQHVLSRPGAPAPATEEPADALVRLAEAEWRAYRSHPWLVEVLASTRPPLVPAVLDAARAVVEVFRAMGLDDDAALDRYLALSAYVQGMGLLLAAEQRETARSGRARRDWWRAEILRLERAGVTRRHPWLGAPEDGSDAFDPDRTFRDGLHRVVRGLVAAP